MFKLKVSNKCKKNLTQCIKYHRARKPVNYKLLAIVRMHSYINKRKLFLSACLSFVCERCKNILFFRFIYLFIYSSFSRSGFHRLQLFAFLVLQTPAFRVPGFTDSRFSGSGFHRFRLFSFQVLQIPAFRVPGFTDSSFSWSGFYRFRLFIEILDLILGLLFLWVSRSVPRFPVPCFTDSLGHPTVLHVTRSPVVLTCC